MSDKHLSTQFDAELSGISTRVMEMGGLVESQIRQAVYALSQFNVEVADQVAATEVRVNTVPTGAAYGRPCLRPWRAEEPTCHC